MAAIYLPLTILIQRTCQEYPAADLSVKLPQLPPNYRSSVPHLRSAWQATKRYLRAPGIVWWGLPTAIVFAVWTTWKSLGYSWRNLLTLDFLLYLIVSIVFIGVFGGRMFGATMRAFGIPLERYRGRDHDRAG